MKKSVLFLSLLPFVQACNDEAILDGKKQMAYFNSLSAIESYIKVTRGADETRAEGISYQVDPFVIDGDTVMYIVNYHPGWQLFSNCSCSPLLLAYSDSGSLDENDILNYDSPRAEHIRMIGEDIHMLNQNIYPSLVAYSEVENVPISAQTPFVDLEPFRTPVQDHLLCTKWGANAPWNSFVRFVVGQHGKVGCAAIGVGQYLYYQHYKTGTPSTAMSHAYLPTPNDSVYSFSNPSTTIWDKMACTRDASDTGNADSTSVFLSYIAEAMNGRFKDNGTYTRPDSCRIFLETQGFSFRIENIDYDYIFNQVMDLEPVIVTVNSSNADSHLAIVDGAKEESGLIVEERRSVFGYVERVVVGKYCNRYLKFNWGYEGYSDDTWYVASNSADWETYYYNPNINYTNPITYWHNQTRKMFKKTN